MAKKNKPPRNRNFRQPLHEELANEGVVTKVKKPKGKSTNYREDGEEMGDQNLGRRLVNIKSQMEEEDGLPQEEDEENINPSRVDGDGYVIIDEEMERLVEDIDKNLNVEAITNTKKGVNLADKIEEALRLHNAPKPLPQKVDPHKEKVNAVYQDVGEYLSRYKSGKIPKAFKIVPKLMNWEEVLLLTDPLNWTPQAMYQATRLFASNFNPKMAQRFYNLILLPACRDDIAANKKLNYHYYQSLKKALFKPSAWFKGILLPLLIDEPRTRDVVIIGSVLARMSIPMLHAAAALIKICESDVDGNVASVIINILLNKKYSLPKMAVERIAHYFGGFAETPDEILAVSWHQAFLTLCQKYGGSLSPFERRSLIDTVKVHFHHKIGPEIRRHLSQQMTIDTLNILDNEQGFDIQME